MKDLTTIVQEALAQGKTADYPKLLKMTLKDRNFWAWQAMHWASEADRDLARAAAWEQHHLTRHPKCVELGKVGSAAKELQRSLKEMEERFTGTLVKLQEAYEQSERELRSSVSKGRSAASGNRR